MAIRRYSVRPLPISRVCERANRARQTVGATIAIATTANGSRGVSRHWVCAGDRMAVGVAVLCISVVSAVGRPPPSPGLGDPGGMAVQMLWGSDWVGQAGATLPDVDACLDVLRSSLRRSLRWLGPHWRGCILKHSARQLQGRVDTEGREAVSAGKPWRGVSGSVWVSLVPVDPEHEKAPHRPGNGR